MTKTFGMLQAQLLLKVLGKSTGFVGIRMICDDKGMGDIPGILGGSGESAGSVIELDCHKNSDLRSEVGTVTG